MLGLVACPQNPLVENMTEVLSHVSLNNQIQRSSQEESFDEDVEYTGQPETLEKLKTKLDVLTEAHSL